MIIVVDIASAPDAPRPTVEIVTPSTQGPSGVAVAPRARPGHFAEREELDAALAQGTLEALDLFIRRHPNSRYRAEAEEAVIRVRQQSRP